MNASSLVVLSAVTHGFISVLWHCPMSMDASAGEVKLGSCPRTL